MVKGVPKTSHKTIFLLAVDALHLIMFSCISLFSLAKQFSNNYIRSEGLFLLVLVHFQFDLGPPLICVRTNRNYTT